MRNALLDMSISVDGFVTPEDETSSVLHRWYFQADADSTGHNQRVIKDLQTRIGAIIMGRRTYDMGDAHDGFMNNPYPVAHFVLTHTPPNTLPKGNTSFTFIQDITQALTQARDAAKGKIICVAGGANIAQQYLNAGLIDTIQLHVVPVILGAGKPLFNTPQKQKRLTLNQVHHSSNVMHVRYDVIHEDEEDVDA